MNPNRIHSSLALVVFAAAGLIFAPHAAALTPEALQQATAGGEKITIIDLRNDALFQKDHIPGAINIPENIIAAKRLPTLGRVVVYCDGLGVVNTAACVAALNAKPGIQAEALEGGLAGWKTFTNATTGSGAFATETGIPTITYEQLEKTAGQDVIILDVRKQATAVRAPGTTDTVAQFKERKLPWAKMARTSKALLDPLRSNKGKFDRAPSLIVVIDDDFTTGEATAKQIQASGYQRVTVLAGGETIIAREGRAGFSRTGSATQIALDPQKKPLPVSPGPAGTPTTATK